MLLFRGMQRVVIPLRHPSCKRHPNNADLPTGQGTDLVLRPHAPWRSYGVGRWQAIDPENLASLFPTLTCGVIVVSAVSAPSSFLPPACPPILPLTHYYQASHPLHHLHTHTHVIAHTHTHTHAHHSHTHTHTHPTHNIIKHHIQYIAHTHTHFWQTPWIWRGWNWWNDNHHVMLLC